MNSHLIDGNVECIVSEQAGSCFRQSTKFRFPVPALKGIGPFFGPLLKGQREPKHYQDDYSDNNPRDEKKRLPGTRQRFGLLRSNPLNFLVR